MLGEIRSFAESGVSFAFETTLSGRSYLPLLRRLKVQGYEIHFFFLWLRVLILRFQGLGSEFQEAATTCRKRPSAEDSTRHLID